MEKRVLGKTGFSVSIFAFGGIVADQTPQDEADAIVAEAVEHGINYFDVAPSYGRAQYILGPALEPFRKKCFLACKTGRRDAAGARQELEESLRALRTDYFDVYQFHGIDNPAEIEQIFAPGGAMETFLWAREKGYVRNIGFSCHQEAAALELMRRFDFATMLFPVNYGYWLGGGAGEKCLAEARRKGMGVIAMKGLADRQWGEQRHLEGYTKTWYKPIYDNRELAELALAFTLSREGVATAISPGDVRMLRLGLDIVEKAGGSLSFDEEKRARLKTFVGDKKELLFS